MRIIINKNDPIKVTNGDKMYSNIAKLILFFSLAHPVFLYGISDRYTRVVPFLVSIVDTKHHFCCGAVLNGHAILTTALCIDSPRPYRGSVGTTTCHIRNYTFSDAFPIAKRYAHPKFNPFTLVGNIAVVYADTSRQKLTNYKGVSSAALLERSLVVGDEVLVFGWNFDFSVSNETEDLWAAHTTVIDPKHCAMHYGKLFIETDMLCMDYYTGKSQQPTEGCELDSSAAAVIQISNTYSIGGLALYMGGCIYRGWPGVFLNTFPYREWIEKRMSYDDD